MGLGASNLLESEGYGFLGEKVRAIDGFMLFGFVFFKMIGQKKTGSGIFTEIKYWRFVWVHFGTFTLFLIHGHIEHMICCVRSHQENRIPPRSCEVGLSWLSFFLKEVK